MRKYILFFLTVILLGSLAFGCATTDSDDIATQNKREADASGLDSHTIGVATYNIRDAQVMMFKEYLESLYRRLLPGCDISVLGKHLRK